jgi:FOG: GAF domain
MLGILSLYTKGVRTFTRDEIDFLSILAEQGGAAIETVNLIRKLRNQSKIFLKLATSISASLDVKTILQTMTEDLVKDLRIKAASVRLLDDKSRTVKLVASYGLSDKYLNKGPIMADKNIGKALKGQTINIKMCLKMMEFSTKRKK